MAHSGGQSQAVRRRGGSGALGSPAPGLRSPVSPAPDRPLLRAIAALDRALSELEGPTMIIGGIAVIARGVPRLTVDVDATVWGEGVDLEQLLATLERHEIVPRISDARDLARRRQVLLLEHRPSGTPLEVSMGWLPFELEAMQRASEVDFEGVRIRVPQVEDLIIYKAVAWRDRDREDIERLLLIHGDSVDLERIRSLVRQFGEALDDPQRIEQLESILERSLGPRR